MENELIKITTNEEGKQCVSARELYLGIGLDKSNWSRWSKKNIIGNEFFAENSDWVGFVTMTNGNEVKDYIVTIDFAKHLAMTANTPQAHEYRNYFIACEKKLKEVVSNKSTSIEEQKKNCLMDIFNGGEQGVIASKKLSEILIQEATTPLLETIEEQKPKAKYTDEVLNNKSLLTITQIAKDFGLSGKALNQILVEQKIQYRQSGQWLLYAKYQDKGYTQSSTYSNQSKSYITTKWTEKGRKFIIDLLVSLGYKLAGKR